MSFRRSEADDVTSSRWLADHRGELADAGVPLDILNDRRAWTHVLLHSDDSRSGWAAEWLSAEQSRKLLDLLAASGLSETGHDLIRILRGALTDPPRSESADGPGREPGPDGAGRSTRGGGALQSPPRPARSCSTITSSGMSPSGC